MADNMEEPDISDMQMNNEMDVDEVPLRRRYKEKSKAKDPRYRRRFDLRNAKSLQTKIQDWYELTKCPTVALTWLNGEIYYSGPRELREFAENPAVKQAFVAAIFASHSVGPNSSSTENYEHMNVKVKIPKDWKQLNAHGKRKLVISLVTNNGTKQPHWGDEDHKPEWWPSSLLFRDPSNGRNRPTVDMLERIIAAHIGKHNAFVDDDSDDGDDNDGDDVDGYNLGGDVNIDGGEDLSDDARDLGRDDANWGHGGENEDGDDDGVNMDRNGKNLAGDARNLGRDESDDAGNKVGDEQDLSHDEEGSSDAEIVAIVPQPVSHNSTRLRKSQDYRQSMSDHGAERAFAALVENLSPNSANLERVMHFIGDVCADQDWALLKNLSETMEELVQFSPLRTKSKPSVCHVTIPDIEISVRCQVPDDMLRSGWEPLGVCGDGNCLFRSVSVSISDNQSESLHQWLKLWCIVHGCVNEHFYIKQFLADADRVDGFLSLITDDDVYGGLKDNMTMNDRVSYVYMREIMKTSVDGRYSGYLQIVLLAGLLKTTICQHCSAPGYELYNTEICPPNGSTESIHLLWCQLSGGTINHIVPMLRCETDEHINTFSENFKTACAATMKCQFAHNLDSAADERWILCEQCLFWYHESCVYHITKRSLPAHWFCGCMKQPECIWANDFDEPTKLRRFFVRSSNSELKLFLRSLAKKEVKSRRVTLFIQSLAGNTNADNLLKQNTGLGIFRDVNTKDYVKRFVKTSIENDDNMLLEEIILLEQREQYIFEVCVPEVVIWIMAKAGNISRALAERFFFEYFSHNKID
ncbi:uncharacterized protein LOC114543566 [Dendronephthya gigantea]|nr:uncharacterized protein LOC114543566 [Dendronephthya gigantea]